MTSARGRASLTPPISKTGDLTEIRLPVDVHAPALARAGVVASTSVSDEEADVLALLVSELVSNVVRHSGLGPTDEMTIRVRDLGRAIRVEVVDAGGRLPPELGSPEQGQGLYLVDRLSAAWGIKGDGSTTAWFELER
jgi:anti-sigma regulatory factor (Ser/Thr protein kinase)